VIIAQSFEKVKLAASTVQDRAEFSPQCGASAPLKLGWGAGGGAGGTGNDAFFGVAGKCGAGLLRPLGWLSVFDEQ
jgi:hypothetical protein